MLQSQKAMVEIDWSQAPVEVLAKAIEEYNIRIQMAEEILRDYTLETEELKRLYYGVPVTFPRKKHAYRIAAEKRGN